MRASFDYIELAEEIFSSNTFFVEVSSSKVLEKLYKIKEILEPNKVEKGFEYYAVFIPYREGERTLAIPAKMVLGKDFNGNRIALLILDIDYLSPIRVRRGRERNEKLEKLVDEIFLFLDELRKGRVDIEEVVPKEVRRGRIHASLVYEKILSKEEAERMRRAYEELKRKIEEGKIRERITLKRFLEVAKIIYDSNFEEARKLSAREAYERYSDFRRAGILEINEESEEAFRKWYYSEERAGAHPFEIIAGYYTKGLHLVPDLEKGVFYISWGDIYYSKYLIRAFWNLINAGVAFLVPAFDEMLRYATRDYFVEVNSVDGLPYEDVKDLEEHIEWYEIELPKFKDLKKQ